MSRPDSDFDSFAHRPSDREKDSVSDASAAPAEDAFLSEFDSEFEVSALARRSHRAELSKGESPGEIPESMPVLRAFHEFLDQERRRSRRRMIILGSALAAVCLLILLIGAIAVVQHQNRVALRYNTMADELLTLREEAVRAKDAAGATMLKVNDRTENLKDILLMSQQALINVQSKIDAQTTVQSREMGALRETLDRLSRDTSAKDEELSMFKVRWADMMRDVRSSREDLAVAQTQPRSISMPSVNGPGSGITISIVPAGSDQPITWRMALPE
jgi:hypothetical protein